VRAVLGIGNIGSRYRRNRHNAGFLILDNLANELSIEFQQAKDEYYICGGRLKQNPFYLIKPVTYVNNSGIAALQFVNEYKLNVEDFLVVCDDINMETGKIRIRKSGGDGGHNGLASIIYHLNTNNFPRLRIGIGKDFTDGEQASYVLDDFSEDDENILSVVQNKTSILLKDFILGGIDSMLDSNSMLFNDESSSNIN
jgi:PTH1 family peptidyl-tRNA hydrolase